MTRSRMMTPLLLLLASQTPLAGVRAASAVLNPDPPLRLSPAGLAPGDEFGGTVATGGGIVAVAAYEAGQGAGAIYLFHQIDGRWISFPVADQPAYRGAPGDRLGFSLALSADGRTLLAGAPAATVGGVRCGAVYSAVVDPARTTPAPLTAFSGAACEAGAEIGSAVALRGRLIAVGARGADRQAGRVYVSTNGSPLTPLTGATPASGDELGLSVATDGERVVAGAPFAPHGGRTDEGSVLVFTRRPAGGWDVASLPGPPEAGRAFGYAVALLGGRIAVGAPLAQGENGEIDLFQQSGGAWSLDGVARTATRAQLGVSLAFGEDGLYAGARWFGGRQGAVFPLHLDGTPGAPLQSSPPRADAEFGFDLAAAGGVLVVGAFAEGGTGAAYVFAEPAPVPAAGLALSPDPLATLEGGPAVPLTIALAGAPAAPVTVTLASDSSAISLSPAVLTFAAGVPDPTRTVSVLSADDAFCAPHPPSRIIARTASPDPRYDGLRAAVSVHMADDDLRCLSGVKKVCVFPDNTVLYAVVLANGGTAAQPDDPAVVEVLDILPPEVSVVAAGADRGVATVDPVANSVAWNGSVPPGGEAVTIRIVAALAAVPPGTPVTNRATITFDRDGRPPRETIQTAPVTFQAGAVPCDPDFPF